MTSNPETIAPASVGLPNVDYNRSALAPGIVHIGCGNFHRAHMAVYLDDLHLAGAAQDWAILASGVREDDRHMRDILAGQKFLYSVIEVGPGHQTVRTIGAITDFIAVEDENAALIAAMSDPTIRIVSLTVTEGGYFLDPDTGTFDAASPEIAADAIMPDHPRTAFGAIIAALRTRRELGELPFAVLSCDNLPHNGNVTRDAVVGLCRLSDPELAKWITEEVAFPNSMVDRITPATGPHQRALAAELGLHDAAPVTCEPFRQWVIEDHFPAGRPPLERVGVIFTDRVDAYELMKIRILNGGHAILAYCAGLAGIEFVHEGMRDPLIRRFLEAVLDHEVIPNVPPVPDVDLTTYKRQVLERFDNPEVADTIRRLCFDGSNRQPKFIVPSLRDGLAAGGKTDGLILLSAIWCRYCYGEDEIGATIAPNDPNWPELQAQARLARLSEPEAWLNMRKVYGELGTDTALNQRFAAALGSVWCNGSRQAMETYLRHL
ncbi:mannitol dehydrogenase family protein [Roseinatronobacter monicus]|nr:mannitol dehydrogenase family protein [Roseinatronobacter monicus]